MKRQFKPDAYYIRTPYECIYLQLTSDAEGCHLLSEHKSVINGHYIYTLLKARKIHETRGGEPYIILRGRRVRLDSFLRTGSAWSSLPEGYTIEY